MSRQDRREYNLDYKRAYNRAYGESVKRKAIEVLGSKCVLCGVDDTRCLEIDHIIPLKKVNLKEHGVSLWRRIAKGENIGNIQLLCANCHAIKTHDNEDRYMYDLQCAKHKETIFHKNIVSEYKGVYYSTQASKWAWQVQINGIRKTRTVYKTAKEASIARANYLKRRGVSNV